MRVEQVTKLIVPHEDGETVFLHPAFKGTLSQLAKQIDSFGLVKLSRPTSRQTISLVDDAWQNPNGKYEKEIIDILKDFLLYEFTGILYVKKQGKKDELCNGVFFEDNPQIKNGMFIMNRQSLTSKLQSAKTIKTSSVDILVSADKTIRYAPFGFKTEELSSSDLAKNAFSIGKYLEEGAEKAARVSGKYKLGPLLLLSELNDNQELIKVPTLSSDFCGPGLCVGGGCHGGERQARASGVLKTGEANTRENK